MIRFIAVVAALISVIGTIQVASAEYLAKCHTASCTHESCRQTSEDAVAACISACPAAGVDSVVQTDCFSKRE
jgi:hypothetical protein